MDKTETIVYQQNGVAKFSLDGHFVDMPDGWEFVPSGDAALTRRIKAQASGYWVVKKRLGRKEFGVGLCAPKGLAARLAAQLQAERATPAYQRNLEAGRQRRAREERLYQADFEDAVIQFLAFHERWRDLAARFAKIVTDFTTPVGSGTVARTERIPIEDRARAAVIAWMRHNTSDYDHRYIPRIAGKRREVRRDIAHDSLKLLETYRRGEDAPENCPLQRALQTRQTPKPPTPTTPTPSPAANQAPSSKRKPRLSSKLSEGDFWLSDSP